VQLLDLLVIRSLVAHAESEHRSSQRAGRYPLAAPYSRSLSASDCSDLLASDPLPARPNRAQVGTIATSEQSALFRCRNNAD
jgi:hypothetical protein